MRIAASAIAFVIACGGQISDDTAGDAAHDAHDGDTFTETSVFDVSIPDASGPCNAVNPSVAETITIEQLAESAPALPMPSAKLFDGVYALQSLTLYTGAGGATGTAGSVQSALQIKTLTTGYDIEVVAVISPQDVSRTSISAVTPTPGELAATETCPTSGESMPLTYFFDGTKLELQSAADTNTTADEVFTLVTN